MRSIVPKLPFDGRRTTADTWPRLRLLTSHGRVTVENNLMLGVNDGAKPGLMKHRLDLPRAVRTLEPIKQKEEKTNPYIPKHVRERQRPLEDRGRLEGTSTVNGPSRHHLLRQLGGNQENENSHKKDKNDKDSKLAHSWSVSKRFAHRK